MNASFSRRQLLLAMLATPLVLSACGDKAPKQPAFRNLEGVDMSSADFAKDFSLLDTEGQRRTMADYRGKIVSTINNARRAQALQAEFGSLAAYIWRFAPDRQAAPQSLADLPAQTDISKAISKDLRKRGWSFVGPTTVYAFMQAMGMVNDHVADCFCRAEVEAEQMAFRRPA